MSQESARQSARELAKPYLASGDNTGWFEPFYASACGNPQNISWANLTPNPSLVQWLDRDSWSGEG